MNIKVVVVGELQENCYVLTIDDECLIVDPGSEEDKIIATVGEKKVLGVLVTHHHFDHVGALKPILEKYNTQLYDYNNLKEQEYQIGKFNFEVIFNPGHTIDSISYYFKQDNALFVGDFIFLETIGRCDLDGGSFIKMQESISKLKEFDANITLYPGHGLKTTLAHEKENNPYF